MKIKKVDNFLDAVKHPDCQMPDCGRTDPTGRAGERDVRAPERPHGCFPLRALFPGAVPKGIDKAQSLAVLLKEIGLTREECCHGDGFNDLSMIQYAGLGIAMANAQEVVKENADFITLSNEEDGDGLPRLKNLFCLRLPVEERILDDALTGMAYTWCIHPASQVAGPPDRPRTSHAYQPDGRPLPNKPNRWQFLHPHY